MKKIFIGAILACFSFAGYAQSSISELELFQSVFNSEKKMLMAEYMKLSEEQSPGFWEVYNAFEIERAEIGKLRFALLQEYAEKYETLDDESAADLLKRANTFAGKLTKVKTKYSTKMAKSIGAKKALQWIQFEAYLDRVIGLYIMENIPFVGEYE